MTVLISVVNFSSLSYVRYVFGVNMFFSYQKIRATTSKLYKLFTAHMRFWLTLAILRWLTYLFSQLRLKLYEI